MTKTASLRPAWRWSAALAFAGLAWDPSARAAEPKRVVLSLIAVVALVVGFGAERTARVSHARRWLFAFVAMAFASAAFGERLGLRELSPWLGAAAIAWALARQGLRASISVARATALAIGVGSAMLAIGSYFGGARGLAIAGGHGNANWLGLVLAIALPFAFEAVVRARRRATRILAGVAVALELWALLMSHGRVAWVATLAAGATMAGFGGWHARRSPRSVRGRADTRGSVALLAIGAVLLGASLAHAAPAISAASEHDGAFEAPVGLALHGRWWIAKASWSAGLAHLPFGAGAGRFVAAYLEAQGRMLAALPLRAAAREFQNATTAHDDWLQAWVEQGVPGLALAIIGYTATLIALVRMRWFAGIGAWIALGVAGLGDSPLRQPAVMAMLAPLVATLPGRRMGPSAAWAVQRTTALRGVLLACMVALLPELTRGWLGTRARVVAEATTGDARVTLQVRAARIDPRDPEILHAVAVSEAELGDGVAARRSFERAQSIEPNLGTAIALAELSRAEGDLSRCIDETTLALRWSPGSARAWALRATCHLERGELDAGGRALGAATEIRPHEPGVEELRIRLARLRFDEESELPR